MNSIESKRVVTKTDLLKQQAERIKELEAELESRKSTNAGWNAYYALRQRIDDAPVVAWTDGEGNFCISAPECCGCSIPIISKEDLQK